MSSVSVIMIGMDPHARAGVRWRAGDRRLPLWLIAYLPFQRNIRVLRVVLSRLSCVLKRKR